MAEESKKVLVFKLGDEEYGIDVMDSKEIIKIENKTITDIPDSSDFIVGITNVRGKVVPIMDLKDRFGLETGREKFIVLIEIQDATAGILVDRVIEVMDINSKRIKEAPELLRQEIHSDYVEDVALLEGDRMITILDLERGFSEEEATRVSQIAEEEEEEEEVEEVSKREIMEKTKEKIK